MDPTVLGLTALHYVGAALWIGGLLGLFGTLRQSRTELILGTGRLHVAVWLGVIISVATGIWRITWMGGMGALPVAVHIKITLALVMIALSAYLSLYLWPRLQTTLYEQESFARWKRLTGLVIWGIVIGALVVLALIASTGDILLLRLGA